MPIYGGENLNTRQLGLEFGIQVSQKFDVDSLRNGYVDLRDNYTTRGRSLEFATGENKESAKHREKHISFHAQREF
jgi:hypothetical protein